MSARPSIAAIADFFAQNPFFHYEPTQGLVPLHTSDHPRRLVRSPNQVGKTWAGAWEAWAHLLGTEAWRRFVPWHPAHVLEVAYPAASGLILVADLDNTYPVICEKLHGTEPTSWLDPATRYIPGKGYYTNGSRFIRTKDGKTIIFRSGEGSPLSVESASVGWVWIDEPPKETHFGGALSRVAVAQGPAWMTFTPVARPTAYLRRHVEGDPETGEGPREDWLQIRPSLTEADCTTISGRVIRSTASIAAQTAAYGPWEYAQRVYGEWEGISVERRLKGFSEACLWDGRLDYDPAAGDELRLSMDHGEGAGKQVAYLSMIRRPKRRAPSAYLLREWSGRENTTPRQVAQGLLDLLGSVGASIHHVKRIVGDVNSAGLAGGGHRYNELVEAELADLLGVSELPIHIQIPFKGKGSVDAGESAISFAAKEGRFYVFSRDGHPYSCRAFIHAARHYTGREKDLKDPIDGVRYGIADVLLASYAANREPQQVLTL